MQEENNKKALRTHLHASSTLSTVFKEWRPLKISYSWEFTRFHGILGSVVKNLVRAILCFLLCLSLAVCESRFLKPEAEHSENYSIRNVEGPL